MYKDATLFQRRRSDIPTETPLYFNGDAPLFKQRRPDIPTETPRYLNGDAPLFQRRRPAISTETPRYFDEDPRYSSRPASYKLESDKCIPSMPDLREAGPSLKFNQLSKAGTRDYCPNIYTVPL